MQRRKFGLDLMRAVAVLLVLLAHTIHLVMPADEALPVSRMLGTVGVEIFFVLSGFLIGGILIKDREKPGPWVVNFWIRRWFRTIPNYYLVLGISVLAAWLSGEPPIGTAKLASFLVFLQNAATVHPPFFEVAWSLSIEEWFYLSSPVVLLIVSRTVPGKRAVLVTALAFVVGCLLARTAFAVTRPLSWDGAVRKLMPLRLDAIAWGVLAAYLRRWHIEAWRARRRTAFAVGSVIAGAALYWYATTALIGPADFAMRTVFFTVLSFGIVLALPLLSRLECRSIVVTDAVTWVSLTSYSVYLTHTLVVTAIENGMGGGRLAFVAAWVATFVIGSAQYSLFEKRMTALRDRFEEPRDVAISAHQ